MVGVQTDHCLAIVTVILKRKWIPVLSLKKRTIAGSKHLLKIRGCLKVLNNLLRHPLFHSISSSLYEKRLLYRYVDTYEHQKNHAELAINLQVASHYDNYHNTRSHLQKLVPEYHRNLSIIKIPIVFLRRRSHLSKTLSIGNNFP